MLKRLLVPLLFLSHFLLLFWVISTKSPTFDEAIHLASGYVYWKFGEFRFSPEHLPLARLVASFPLLFMDLYSPTKYKSFYQVKAWEFSDEFIFENKINFEKIFIPARIAISIFSIILGCFIFLFAKKLYGINSAFFSLAAYLFCPNILAHAPLVTTDLAASCTIFLCIYFYIKFLKQPDVKNAAFFGISLGFMLAAKFATVSILPVFIFGFFVYKLNLNRIFLKLFIIFVFAYFTLVACYMFTGLDYYIAGFKKFFGEATLHGHTSYLCGDYSNVGWRHYYLIAFILKSTIPSLILFVYALSLRKFGKDEMILMTAMALVFIAASFSKKQLGIRYVLPFYPLMYLFIGRIMKFNISSILKLLSFFLLLYHSFSSIKISPHFISYFNEFAGGADNGWKYLGNSNIDWGQDLKLLKKYITKEGVSDVVLSYYGIVNPKHYGINYQSLSECTMHTWESRINSSNPQKEVLAISVNNLLGIYYYDRDVFKWLRDRAPDSKVGYSIFIYDITNDVKSHEQLVQIYFESGWVEESLRHCKRLLMLDEGNKLAKFTLACIHTNRGEKFEAVKCYREVVNQPIELNKNHILNFYHYVIGAGKKVTPGNYYTAFFEIAKIFFEMKMYDYAVDVYSKLVSNYPSSKEGYYNLGIAYENLKEIDKAIRSYKKVLEIDPNDVFAKSCLERLSRKE